MGLIYQQCAHPSYLGRPRQPSAGANRAHPRPGVGGVTFSFQLQKRNCRPRILSPLCEAWPSIQPQHDPNCGNKYTFFKMRTFSTSCLSQRRGCDRQVCRLFLCPSRGRGFHYGLREHPHRAGPVGGCTRLPCKDATSVLVTQGPGLLSSHFRFVSSSSSTKQSTQPTSPSFSAGMPHHSLPGDPTPPAK